MCDPGVEFLEMLEAECIGVVIVLAVTMGVSVVLADLGAVFVDGAAQVGCLGRAGRREFDVPALLVVDKNRDVFVQEIPADILAGRPVFGRIDPEGDVAAATATAFLAGC